MQALLGAGLATILPIILIAFYSKVKPVWLADENLPNIENVTTNWKKYNLIALISGIVLGLLTFGLLYLTNHGNISVFIAPTVSVLTVLTVISILTDTNLRLVDRWILRLGLLAVLVSSVSFLLMYGTTRELIVYGVILGFISLYFFIPSLGMSDTRALLIICAAIFPFFSTLGVAASIGGALIAACIYIFRKEGFKIKSLVAKVSLPLVPIILGPAIPVMIAGVFIF